MRTRKLIFTILTFLALLSCEKENTPGGAPAPKDGCVAITFNTEKMLTRAYTDEETAALADGSMFNDLWLWLVRKEGATEDLRRFVHYKDFATTERKEVTFAAVERGDYVLYAVANFTNDRGVFTNYTPAGYSVNDEKYLADDIEAAAKKQLDDNFKKLTLATLENGVPPTGEKNGGKMPISLVKEFSVGAGENRVSAELVRVCGRISVIVRNLSPEYSVAINDLVLSPLNPNIGYLFADGDNVPGGADFYQEFIPFTKKEGKDYALIAPGGTTTILSQMIYETGNDIELGLSIGGGMLVDSDMNPIPENSYTCSISKTTVNYYQMSSAVAPVSGGSYIVAPVSNTAKALYVNDNNLSLNDLSYYKKAENSLTAGNINNYLWTYSTGNPTLTNVAGGRYLSISSYNVSLSNRTSNNTSISLTPSGSGYNLYYNYYYYYYYLRINSNNLSVYRSYDNPYNDDSYRWQFIPVEQRTVTSTTATTNGKDINYSTNAVQVIGSTGAAVKLSRLRRNQDLRIILNISYNPYIGEFEYVILPWTDVVLDGDDGIVFD